VAAGPRLSADGLGALTGNTRFDLAAIQQALPELTWARIEGAGHPHLIGSLDGAPAVIAGGFHFVETIRVVSPRIASALGIAIGAPSEAIARKINAASCVPDEDPLDDAKPVELSCSVNGIEVLLGDAPPPSGPGERAPLAGRRVVGLRVHVEPDPSAFAGLGERTHVERDPAVERSRLLIDRTAIHPVTDLASITRASLQAALPGMDIAPTPDGFTVSRGGARVLAITVSGGAPARVEAFHPSIRSKLGVGIDETFAEADERSGETVLGVKEKLRPLCTSDGLRFSATCALSELPRIELVVAASTRMPRHFYFSTMRTDAWVTSIVWTAPRTPAHWPTIDNDHVGALTPAIVKRRDDIDVRAAFPGFDLVGRETDGLIWIDGFVGKKNVLTYVGGRVTVADPRIRLAGIGVGATMQQAEAAGLGPFECIAASKLVKGDQDSCSTKLSRVRLKLEGRGALSGAALGARRISAIFWLGDL